MTESEQIEAIYEAYPRKVGKRAALKAIEKAVGRVGGAYRQDGGVGCVGPEEARRFLWKRTKQYALSPAGQKPPDGSQDYRPHPSTWFNQDRFFDDSAEWQKPNGGNGNGKKSTVTDPDKIARANARLADLGGHSVRTS